MKVRLDLSLYNLVISFFEINMPNYNMKTLAILPHLDDEFALVPLIRDFIKLNLNNIKFVFCAERNNSKKEEIYKRRHENLKSLELLGYKDKEILYLNDYFIVDDLKLYKSAQQINEFLIDYSEKFDFKQIITLNFEGGHPDHDALALIVSRFKEERNINSFFIPAYNYQRTFLIPFSAFKPLNSQRSKFSSKSFSYFCWAKCLKIASLYTTERKAFIKLLPFIIFKTLLSKKIYLTTDIDTSSVCKQKSFTNNRYNVGYIEIFKSIEAIK